MFLSLSFRISLESLKCDINSLANKIFKLKQQINSTNDCSEYWSKAGGGPNEKNSADEPASNSMNNMFFEHMREFLSDAEKQIKQLTQKVETDLEQIRTQLGKQTDHQLVIAINLNQSNQFNQSILTVFYLTLSIQANFCAKS